MHSPRVGRSSYDGRGTRVRHVSRVGRGCAGTITARISQQHGVFNSSTRLRNVTDSVRVGLNKATDKWAKEMDTMLSPMIEDKLTWELVDSRAQPYVRKVNSWLDLENLVAAVMLFEE